MKKWMIIVFAFASCIPVAMSQSVQLTVINGTGAGWYDEGDTVHIFQDIKFACGFSSHIPWVSSYPDILLEPNEWHTRLVMPSADVTVEGSEEIPAIVPPDVGFGYIPGYNEIKPIRIWYPYSSSTIGLIWLFDDAQFVGSGQNCTGEQTDFIYQAIVRGFVVIQMDAEEVTIGDQDGDGRLEWDIQMTNPELNIDLQNIKVVRDSLIKSQWKINSEWPQYTVGMGNGGSFASLAAIVYDWSAVVSFCEEGEAVLFQETTVPTRWNMARYDQDTMVSNSQAYANYQALVNRGICAAYWEQERSPLYRERFERAICDEEQSAALYQELEDNNQLSDGGWIKESFEQLEEEILGNPTVYPTWHSLSIYELPSSLCQLKVTMAEHAFYADRNQATLDFLIDPCMASPIDQANTAKAISVFPNPSAGQIWVDIPDESWHLRGVVSALGQWILCEVERIDTKLLQINMRSRVPGLYHVLLQSNKGDLQSIPIVLK